MRLDFPSYPNWLLLHSWWVCSSVGLDGSQCLLQLCFVFGVFSPASLAVNLVPPPVGAYGCNKAPFLWLHAALPCQGMTSIVCKIAVPKVLKQKEVGENELLVQFMAIWVHYSSLPALVSHQPLVLLSYPSALRENE